MKSTLKERLEKNQWKRKRNQCWPWLRYIDSYGNGRIWASNEEGSITVQNAVWRVLGRSLLPGEKVLSCPILKDCTNPDHISSGKGTDIGDRILWKKGLKRHVPKEKVPIERKLSDEQVRQIFLSKETSHKLAEQYGISQPMVVQIWTKKKYRRITENMER